MSDRSLSNTCLSAIAAACVLVSAAAVGEEQALASNSVADTEATVSESTTGATIGRSSVVEAKLSSEFAEFLGGEARAAEVVGGLRTGAGFSWTDAGVEPPADGQTVEPVTTTETPAALPTGSMGYGNVRLTLRFAEARLAQMGVSQPSAEELSAVLVGGEINGVPVDGILAERAAGSGWGEIAQRYGFKVGDLMGKGRQPIEVVSGDGAQPAADDLANTGPAEPQSTRPSQHNTEPTRGPSKGEATVSSAAKGTTQGKAASAGAARLANGYIPSKTHGTATGVTSPSAYGHAAKSKTAGAARSNGYIPSSASQGKAVGLVSAGGAGIASGRAKGHVDTHGAASGHAGGGIVSAGNASAAATVSHAGGNGLAKGHARGKP